MGFCFVNNVVVGAQAALEAGADRVAIVDWDVHHGNGSQDICYERGDVFNVSLHESGLYPGTGEIDETGADEGDMRNLNVPFPPGTDTVGYLAAFDEVILPTLREYDPNVVLVSAGFDAHQHDPISRMRVSTEGYGLMTERLLELVDDCDAGLGFVLEGGYSLDTLADSIATVNETVAGYDPQAADGEVSEGARDVLDDLLDQGFGSK
jgi:acetoin utilization deacetylase AcuC-like enzyme